MPPDKIAASIWYARHGLRVCLANAADPAGFCTCAAGTAQARGLLGDNGKPIICKSPGKHPRGKGWPLLASADPGKARAMWKSEPGAIHLNYSILPDESNLILDLDRKPGRPDGVALACLLSGMSESQLIASTLSQITPSGGIHLLYHRRTRVAHKIKVGVAPGIDLPIQAIGAGSKVRGGFYSFGAQITPALEPDWASGLIQRWRDAEKSKAKARPVAPPVLEYNRRSIGEAELIRMLRHLDPACGYSDWRDLVFAIAAAPCDSDLEEIARRWSMGELHPDSDPNYDESAFDLLWNSNRASGGISFGTLVHFARAAGFTSAIWDAWLKTPQAAVDLNAAKIAEARESVFRSIAPKHTKSPPARFLGIGPDGKPIKR